jgi:hypothetical protein
MLINDAFNDETARVVRPVLVEENPIELHMPVMHASIYACCSALRNAVTLQHFWEKGSEP